MKKKLLLGALLVGSIFTAKAQDSCAEAVEVTPGTYTVEIIDGTFVDGCFTTPATAAEWYSYTPTANGLATIRTDIDANDIEETDTRFSVFTGECGALTCYIANDDISQTDFRSAATFPVEAGTTYYISFDDRWADTGFDFELTYAEVSCFAPTGFAYSQDNPPTATTVNITWNAPILSTPESYEFEYGLEGFTQGEGIETLTVDGLEAALTDLEPGTDYAFYIRSICGEGDESEWTGPITFYTLYGPADLPYNWGFEADTQDGGWVAQTITGAEWGLYIGNDVAAPYEGEQFAGIIGAAAASDSWYFSRPINIEADQTVNISYYLEFVALAGAGNENNLTVTIGDDITPDAQTNVVGTFENYTTTPYTLQNHEFTASESGVYYVGFHYTAPAHTQNNNGGLLLDSFSVTDALNVDNILASQFSVYPNPANNVINISNADNVLVNGVEIVDINGRVVKSAKFDNVTEAQINIADLSAGMYLMTISSDNGTTTKKIVKN